MLDDKQWKNQNVISKFDRLLSGIIASFLSIYMIISVANNQIYIPGKHNNGLLLTGMAAKMCITALSFVIVYYLLNIANHYNKSKSRILIFYMSKAFSFIAGFLFIASLVVQFITQK